MTSEPTPAARTDVLPDVLRPGLRLVFCGTAAGRRSAADRAYYAHPGNMFWRALWQAGLTPHRLEPAQYRELLDYGIGLTDLAKRHIGNDSELPHDAFDVPALRTRIAHHAPHMLAFTSKQAGRQALGHAVTLGLQPEQFETTRLFVLPSPSGQARGHWDIQPWRDLARLLTSP